MYTQDSLVMHQKIDVLFEELDKEHNTRNLLQQQLDEFQRNSHKRNYEGDGDDT